MGVPSLLARKLLMPRLLHMAHGIQTYFQQLRPLHNCTQEDGKAVGNLLMVPVIIRILTRIIRILTRIIRILTRRTTCCPPRSITGPMWRRPSACAQQCSAMRPSRTSIPSWWLSRAASTAEAVASRRSIIRARTHIIRALIRIIRTPIRIVRSTPHSGRPHGPNRRGGRGDGSQHGAHTAGPDHAVICVGQAYREVSGAAGTYREAATESLPSVL